MVLVSEKRECRVAIQKRRNVCICRAGDVQVHVCEWHAAFVWRSASAVEDAMTSSSRLIHAGILYIVLCYVLSSS